MKTFTDLLRISAVTALVIGGIAPAPALAQASRIQIHTVDVRPGTPRSFMATTDIRMTVEPSSFAGVWPDHVRIYAGMKRDLLQTGRRTEDGCREYHTTVVPFQYRRGRLYVAETDRTWLAAPGGERYERASFVLVFESGAPPSPTIRIWEPDLEGYFSRGIEIDVFPDDYLPELVAEEVAEHRRNYKEYVRLSPRFADSSGEGRECLEVVEDRPALLAMRVAACDRDLQGRSSSSKSGGWLRAP